MQESLTKTAQILRENAIPVSGAKSGHKAPTDFSTSKFKHERRSASLTFPLQNPSMSADFAWFLPTKRLFRAVFQARARILLGFCPRKDFSAQFSKHTRGFCSVFALTRILSASSPYFTRIRLPGKDNTQTHSASPFRNVGYNKICRPLKDFFKNREYFPQLMCLYRRMRKSRRHQE